MNCLTSPKPSRKGDTTNNTQQITDHPLIDMDAAPFRYYGPFRIDRLTFARSLLMASLALMFVCLSMTSSAQPVALTPSQLDQLVARIALYPDPLLAQVLTASTYWSEIPEAASWAHQHSYLKADALAQAMQADHLQWDPSILALLLFASTLDMMAHDPAWTEQLGNAVLTQEPEVMDAMQRMPEG